MPNRVRNWKFRPASSGRVTHLFGLRSNRNRVFGKEVRRAHVKRKADALRSFRRSPIKVTTPPKPSSPEKQAPFFTSKPRSAPKMSRKAKERMTHFISTRGMRPHRKVKLKTLARFIKMGEITFSRHSRPRQFKRSNLIRQAFTELLDDLNHVYFLNQNKPVDVRKTPVFEDWKQRWESFLQEPGVWDELRQLARSYERVLGPQYVAKYLVLFKRMGLASKESEKK